MRVQAGISRITSNSATTSAPISNVHPLFAASSRLKKLSGYLREALSGWLAAGEEINYSAQDNDILTAIGFRPDAASRDDNREKYTPAQNQNYVNKRAELAAQ
jgi:hypothetical protein